MENHSRRQRNKRARLANIVVGSLFLVVFTFAIVSFTTVLRKQIEILNEEFYSNSSRGSCILYADYDIPSGTVHLGKSSGLCSFIIYGECLVMVYSLVMFFALAFKVILGCALMRFDLIIELIFLVIITIFQFLLGIALTSGTNDTCKAIKESNTTNSCISATLPLNDGYKFYGHLITSIVFIWLSVALMLFIIVYYLVVVNICVHQRIKSRRGRSDVLVDENDNQVYALESETELQDNL
uniref:Uncharacterized protein n=1 Tax=Amphimedon queenslandica TaxID=400682 RepID=A0A1X7VD63_AMPQE